MPEQIEHSPTPWALDGTADANWTGGICDPDGNVVVWTSDIRHEPETGIPNPADAAFIVKAVNCHDDLAAALEQALDRMEQVQGWARDGLVKAGHIPQMDAAIAHAKAALAKVEAA